MSHLCPVCGGMPIQQEFYNSSFTKCQTCASVFIEEDEFVTFILDSVDATTGLTSFHGQQTGPAQAEVVSCFQCEGNFTADIFVMDRIRINIHRCSSCDLIMLYPADLLELNQAIHAEKKRVFQTALVSGL